MKTPIEIIQKQKEIDSFIKTIENQLLDVSIKKHPKLNNIIRIDSIDDSGISFTAAGFAMGYFDETFDVEWEELN